MGFSHTPRLIFLVQLETLWTLDTSYALPFHTYLLIIDVLLSNIDDVQSELLALRRIHESLQKWEALCQALLTPQRQSRSDYVEAMETLKDQSQAMEPNPNPCKTMPNPCKKMLIPRCHSCLNRIDHTRIVQDFLELRMENEFVAAPKPPGQHRFGLCADYCWCSCHKNMIRTPLVVSYELVISGICELGIRCTSSICLK